MHLKSVEIQYERYPVKDIYPFNIPSLRDGAAILMSSAITCFVGENGTGKSTLLEAIAASCNIHIWRNSERSRPDNNPYETTLHRYVSVHWQKDRVPGSFFGSEIFRHFAEILDEWAAADPGQLKYFGGSSLTTQSHGQSLMSYFRNRYRLRGLYFLDEPEAALSPRSQIELLRLMTAMGAAGHAQFIISTHSPILLAAPGASIYSFDHHPIQRIGYEQTDHYLVYKGFMENREDYLGPEPWRENESIRPK